MIDHPNAAAPVPISQALFSVAPQGDDHCTRAQARARIRQSLRPPGFLGSPWRTANSFFFQTAGKRYTTPAGVSFNGASVPFVLTWLVPRTHALYLAATAQHDHHYSSAASPISRCEADEVLWAACIFLGLHCFWATIIRRAVRSGGWMHFRKPPERVTGPIAVLSSIGKMALTILAFSFGLILIDLPRAAHYRNDAERVIKGTWAWTDR